MCVLKDHHHHHHRYPHHHHPVIVDKQVYDFQLSSIPFLSLAPLLSSLFCTFLFSAKSLSMFNLFLPLAGF